MFHVFESRNGVKFLFNLPIHYPLNNYYAICNQWYSTGICYVNFGQTLLRMEQTLRRLECSVSRTEIEYRNIC